MHYLIYVGIIFITFGTILTFLGASKDSTKEFNSTKQYIEEKHDINRINQEAEKNKPQVLIITKNSTSTNENESYVDITIEVKNTPLESVAIDYPLQGTIKNIKDLNSTTDAKGSIKKSQGASTGEATNNLNLFVENITPDRKLTYRIFYIPTLQDVFIGGRDTYEVTFNWQYKGNNYIDTNWRFVVNDELTIKPSFQIKNVEIHNRVFTPEEIKKSFEQGMKERNFE